MAKQDYTVGDLLVNIASNAKGVDGSFTNIVKRLDSLRRAVNNLVKTDVKTAGDKLSLLFYNISKSLVKIDTRKIEKLSGISKAMANITRIKKLEDINWAKSSSGFSMLTVAITPFVDKVKEAEQSLIALNGILSKTSGKKIQNLLTQQSTTDTKKTKKTSGYSKSLNTIFSLAKFRMLTYYVAKLGRGIANIVQKGSDYTETLNLWSVAMRNNLDLADKFVRKMNTAYGISEKTLMNAQATFKNMIGSLGQISENTAYALSETITQMAIDFSSLYNVNIEQAFQKFEAMLAGQVRPIRSGSGYDVTETTLFQLYQQIGGTKTMRQLTRTEKQLLSILAVFNQMGRSGALGDMSKTLGQIANQSRMFAENWQRTLTFLGIIIKHTLDETKLLVHINALLITASEIFKAIAKSIGALDNSGFLDTMFEPIENTNEELDKLQGKLLDFDKFRSLEGGQQNNILGIDEKLLEAITGYSSVVDKTKNEAQEMASKILESLGFVKALNGEWTITDENLKKITSKIDVYVDLFRTIIGAVKEIYPAIQPLMATILQVIDTFMLDAIDFIKKIIPSVKKIVVALTPVFNIVKQIVEWITPITRALFRVVEIIVKIGAEIIAVGGVLVSTIMPIVETIVKAVQTTNELFLALVNFDFRGLGDKIKSIWSNWDFSANMKLTASNYLGQEMPIAPQMSTPNLDIAPTNSFSQREVAQATEVGVQTAMANWWSKAKKDIPQFREISKTGIYEVAKSEARRRGEI